MRWLRRMGARLRSLATPSTAREAETQWELDALVDIAADEFVRRGHTVDEAYRLARLQAGNMTQTLERVREARRVPWLDGSVADLRYAWRRLRRTPLHSLTMIVVLALGLGTSAFVLTVWSSLDTAPPAGLPRDPALVRVRGAMQDQSGQIADRLLPWAEVERLARDTATFSSVVALAEESAVLRQGDGSVPAAVRVVYTSSNHFATLRVRPILGSARATLMLDPAMSEEATATLSFGAWSAHFASDPGVVGRTIRLNGYPIRVGAVAPQAFNGTSQASDPTIWVPLAAYPSLHASRTDFLAGEQAMFMVLARLQPGVSRDQAAAVVRQVTVSTLPAAPRGSGAQAMPVRHIAEVVPLLANNSRRDNRDEAATNAGIAVVIAVLSLLLTAVNVSVLMVGLALARRREMAVRVALGAGRGRVMRQLVTESVVLTGAAAGLALLAIGSVARVAGPALSEVPLSLDWRVVLVTAAMALVVAALLAIAPSADAARVPVGAALNGARQGATRGTTVLQRSLVVGQVALAQPLLVGLSLAAHTTIAAPADPVDLARADQLVELELDTWTGGITSGDRQRQIQRLVDRTAELPGVVHAYPMQMGTVTVTLTVHPDDQLPGISYPAGQPANLVAAPPGYFTAHNLRIDPGRDFLSADRWVADSSDVSPPSRGAIIIGRDLAQRWWGNANPIGRRILREGSGVTSEALVVVGVVAVDETGEPAGRVRLYVPQLPLNTGVVALSGGASIAVLDAMRDLAAMAAPAMPVVRAETARQRLVAATRVLRQKALAAATSGAITLALAALALYATGSFSVQQRTREIGVRAALGATPRQLVGQFFGQGVRLAAMGLIIGLPLSVAVAVLLTRRLLLPSESPVTTGALVGAAVLLVAALSAWLPARRATAIAPTEALRSE